MFFKLLPSFIRSWCLFYHSVTLFRTFVRTIARTFHHIIFFVLFSLFTCFQTCLRRTYIWIKLWLSKIIHFVFVFKILFSFYFALVNFNSKVRTVKWMVYFKHFWDILSTSLSFFFDLMKHHLSLINLSKFISLPFYSFPSLSHWFGFPIYGLLTHRLL